MAKHKLIKHGYLILSVVLIGPLRSHPAAPTATLGVEVQDSRQETLLAWGRPFEEGGVSILASVEKSVLPQGQVKYGDELTYTLTISATPGTQVGLYDPLMDTTFMRFVEQPSGVTHANITSGTLRIGVITGTLTFTSTDQITVSFVAQVAVPGTLGWTVTVTNRACVYPFGGSLEDCAWSNKVSNTAVGPGSIVYLPLVSKPFPAPYKCERSYYVDSVTGSDANPGTSRDRPWRTLAPVRAMDFAPSDCVFFKRGSSWTGDLVIDDSGTRDSPIVFTTYGTGDKPILRNPGRQSHLVAIKADWVIVEGLLLRDGYYSGMLIGSGSEDNVVRDIEIAESGSGIIVAGQHNLVTRNYIHDLQGNAPFAAVGIYLFGSHNEASYNKMINCIDEDGGGFEIYGDEVNGSYIHHNWVSNSFTFVEIGSRGGVVRDTLIAYNVSFNNNGHFSLISLTGEWGTQVENFRVDNNTIVQTVSQPSRKVVDFVGQPTANTFLLRNNIFYIDSAYSIFDETGFTHDHNLYHLGDSTRLGVTLGQGEMIVDPLFLNLAEWDIHLLPESPAIDAGVNLGYVRDFSDRPVPVGADPDLGAFEYQSTPENELIIDDADPAFSTVFSQDSWQEYTAVEGQHYGDTHYYNRQIGTGEDTATWSFTVPQPGRYQVYAWWWEGSWRPTDVPYTINCLDGAVVISSTTVSVNQQTSGGQWNLLGTFGFQDQGSVTVSDDVSSGQDIVADAIRLVYLEPLIYTSVSQPLSTPTPTLMPPTPSDRNRRFSDP
jgi:hypothetical protein